MSRSRVYPLVIATLLAVSACGSSGAATDESSSSGTATSSTTTDSTTATTTTNSTTGSTTGSTAEPTPDPTTDSIGLSAPVEPVTTPAATEPDERTDDVSTDANVQIAIDDLAEYANVAAADITLVANERVTWRDGSVGCPVDGRAYTQAIVDGYRIVLSIDSVEFEYHGSALNPPFRCDKPQAPIEGSHGDA